MCVLCFDQMETEIQRQSFFFSFFPPGWRFLSAEYLKRIHLHQVGAAVHRGWANLTIVSSREVHRSWKISTWGSTVYPKDASRLARVTKIIQILPLICHLMTNLEHRSSLIWLVETWNRGCATAFLTPRWQCSQTRWSDKSECQRSMRDTVGDVDQPCRDGDGKITPFPRYTRITEWESDMIPPKTVSVPFLGS